jgi:hypothetical protein
MTWAERRVLARALVLLPVTVAGIRVFGYGRMRAFLVPDEGSGPAGQDLPAAQALARLVYGAAGWSPGRASCLPRSLVLCRLLAKQGLQAEIRLGVAKSDGSVTAHAWVEHAGVALAEPVEIGQRFSTLHVD